jgi:hypothetical protein
MAIDQNLIGQMAAQLMEELEKAYGSEAKLAAAALVIAVDHGNGKTVHFTFGPDLSTEEGFGLLEQVQRSAVRGQTEVQ